MNKELTDQELELLLRAEKLVREDAELLRELIEGQPIEVQLKIALAMANYHSQTRHYEECLGDKHKEILTRFVGEKKDQ